MMKKLQNLTFESEQLLIKIANHEGLTDEDVNKIMIFIAGLKARR